MMHRRLIAMLVALTVLAVACGAPKSSGFSAIPPGNLPDGLNETTTTSTTTTLPETTTSVVEEDVTTTTTAPVPTTNPTVQVTLYFVSDLGGQLVPTEQYISSDAAPVVLSALAAGPDPLTAGLRTAVPADARPTPIDYRGLVTIDLPPNFFASMADLADERLAIAQIVLTLTGVRGIANVRFTIDGEPIIVLLGTGEPSEPGQVLVKEDYIALLGNTPPPSTTTTTTTTTTTIAEPPPTDLPVETVPPATG